MTYQEARDKIHDVYLVEHCETYGETKNLNIWVWVKICRREQDAKDAIKNARSDTWRVTKTTLW